MPPAPPLATTTKRGRRAQSNGTAGAKEVLPSLACGKGPEHVRQGGVWNPLARKTSPLSAPPPRSTRFGSPLVLSRVHWVEPKLVAEITYLTWTGDNLLRQTVYVGLREEPAEQVRHEG
jgi:hypothetical protein